MAITNFQTNTMTFRQLVGNGTTYKIPPFQRDYSWGSDEWEDLWQDLRSTISESVDASHYMGYLVLREESTKEYSVIDGQQRLTTITIVVLAALNQLKLLSNNEGEGGASARRMEALRQSYIGFVDPVSLQPKSKLQLNRNNDTYFQGRLVALREVLPTRGLKSSEKRLRDAFLFFNQKLEEFIRDSVDPGTTIAQFIDQMGQALVFTVITVTNELNAYTVFETLNARGVKLSSTDLLKNYLFSVLFRGRADPQELSRLEDRWERILGDLESENFPSFVRAHWMSRNGIVRESELFKTIRARVSDRAAAFSLLDKMEDDVETYLSLSKPETSGWTPEDKKSAKRLRLFNVRQPFPLLMAAKRRFSAGEFTILLKTMVDLTFRFTVIANGQSSELETAFSAEAGRIERGESTTARQSLINLRGVYVPDDQFRVQFADVIFDTTKTAKRKLVRYILGELEAHFGGIPVDTEDDIVSIEHICPSNPDLGWDAFSDRDIDELATRLGNFTLLEKSKNQLIGNSSYEVKKSEYERSSFIITRRISEQYQEWTPAALDARQNEMARVATAVWRINQLS